MHPKTRFVRQDGRMFAILNWRIRQADDDAIVSEFLTRQEEQLYISLKAGGYDEAAIFDRLFPIEAPGALKVQLDIDMLTKGQLLYLLINRLEVSLPSLREMNRKDLKQLYIRIAGMAKRH